MRCLSGDTLPITVLPRKLSKRFAVHCLATLANGVRQATIKHGLVSLPDPGAKIADGSALKTCSDLEAWRDWRRVLLRSPNELREVIAREGRVAPHTDPVLRRKPQCYARLVREMSLLGLESFGAQSEATVGIFVVPKKLEIQRLMFDSRQVNQHFRRPWHCVAHTCNLDGVTTSIRLCVPHGTDRREHCILAHTGTSRTGERASGSW